MSRNPQKEPRNIPRFPHFLPRINQPLTTKIATTISLALALSTPLFSQTSIEQLRHNFQNPPADAKPMMRWWWFGTAVEKPEILRELKQMQADGIGGVELAFVYPQTVDDPSKGLTNHPFLSPEMLDAVHYAQSEARKLGLRVDVTLGSGWPYGGPATTLEEAATRLRTIEIPLPANATTLPQPKLAEGESILSISLVSPLAADSSLHCGFAYGNVCGAPPVSAPIQTSAPDFKLHTWDAATPQTINPSETNNIPVSDKPRTALFFIQSHTRQQVKRAALGAEGYVLDPFSQQAVATHLKAVGEPLVKAFGDTSPYAIFSDSLEAYGADWTPNLPAEFLKRRGYDILPHLPELVAGGTPAAEKIRHDWGQTLTELVNQNYLTQINNWAIEHHTKFRSQTYGEPAVSLSSQRLVALPEGEGPRWREFSTLRWASSANHLFGNNITSAETFTWLHSPVFRATPLDMKAEADLHFLIGVNQIIGHGWPYSPPQAGEPGWSLYAAAVFNNNNPWHPVMPDVTRYIQRISYLLRQGEPANQVALLLPTDDAWAHFSPGKVSVTGEMTHLITPALMSAILSAGYNVDFIDADTINRQGLGDHTILLLPPTDRIPVETLQRIYEWRKAQYAISTDRQYDVVCYERCPSIDPEGAPLPGMTGSFLVAKDLKEVTSEMLDIAKPDFTIRDADDNTAGQLGFIRRTLPNADIYFVANTSNQPINTTATFATTHKFAEQWDPDSTTAAPATTSAQSIHLAPYESRVFVFSETAEEPRAAPHKPSSRKNSSLQPFVLDLSNSWQLHFTATNKTETQTTLTDWIANPETKFYSGEAVYTRDFTLAPLPTNPVSLEIEGGSPTAPQPLAPPDRPVGIRNPLVTGTGPGMRAWYDPPVREAAIVYINGQRAGSLWHPPYRLEVTHLLKPGPNHIEIRVYNTAINAWAALPPRDYKPLIEKFGDRFQMQDLDKVKPVPSGLLGTIHLISEVNKE